MSYAFRLVANSSIETLIPLAEIVRRDRCTGAQSCEAGADGRRSATGSAAVLCALLLLACCLSASCQRVSF